MMQAPQSIRSIWDRFGEIPMETFTKGWWHRRCGGRARQRTVAEMVEHRRALGAGGNCFDLALWLRHDLQEAGIEARVVGHDLGTPEAHVAVLAVDGAGAEYLCDLGDCWLQPVLISPEREGFDPGWHADFFPGREIQVRRDGVRLEVCYRRASGKVSRQVYDLSPVGEEELRRACDHSQNLLRRPFCERLLPHPRTGERAHWEYDRGRSFWNLADGPVFEEPCATAAQWVERIAQRTGVAPSLLEEGFRAYGVIPGQG